MVFDFEGIDFPKVYVGGRIWYTCCISTLGPVHLLAAGEQSSEAVLLVLRDGAFDRVSALEWDPSPIPVLSAVVSGGMLLTTRMGDNRVWLHEVESGKLKSAHECDGSICLLVEDTAEGLWVYSHWPTPRVAKSSVRGGTLRMEAWIHLEGFDVLDETLPPALCPIETGGIALVARGSPLRAMFVSGEGKLSSLSTGKLILPFLSVVAGKVNLEKPEMLTDADGLELNLIRDATWDDHLGLVLLLGLSVSGKRALASVGVAPARQSPPHIFGAVNEMIHQFRVTKDGLPRGAGRDRFWLGTRRFADTVLEAGTHFMREGLQTGIIREVERNECP